MRITVDGGGGGPAVVRVVLRTHQLLNGGLGRAEGKATDLAASALHACDDFGQDKVTITRAARSFRRQRVVGQDFQSEADHAADFVGEAQDVRVLVRVFTAGENRLVIADFEGRALRGLRFGGSPAGPERIVGQSRQLRLLPLGIGLGQLGMRPVKVVLQIFDRLDVAGQFGCLLCIGHEHARFAGANDGLIHIREKRTHRIEIPGGNGIEFVIVALGAADGLAEPDRAHCAHAIREITRLVILGLGTAFFRGEQQAVETGGDFLFLRGVGQEIARELFAGELVKAFVVVEGADDVVAIRPDVARGVGVISDGIGKPHDIEPANRHALTVLGRGHQAVDQFLVGIGRCVLFERVDFLRFGRKAGQIKIQAAGQRAAIGRSHGFEAQRTQACAHQGIDRFRSGWDLGFNRGQVSPVPLILRALGDPTPDQFLLRGGEGLVRLRRRHLFIRIGAEQPAHDFAILGFAGDQRHFAGFGLLDGRIAQVQTQTALDLLRVGPMAGKAIVRQDGPDIAVEIDLRGGLNRRGGEQTQAPEQNPTYNA